MIYRDIKLDDTGDLDLDAGGALVADEEAIAQEIQVRLHTDQGEYFLDTSRGLPFKRWQQSSWRASTTAEAQVLIRSELLSVPGVASIAPPGVSVNFDQTTRRVTVAAQIYTDTGELIPVEEVT